MKIITKFMLIISVLLYSNVSFSLTKEQCDDYKSSGSFRLSPDDEDKVKKSCLKRYKGNDNAMLNCTYYEGQDLLDKLKEQAKSKCK